MISRRAFLDPLPTPMSTKRCAPISVLSPTANSTCRLLPSAAISVAESRAFGFRLRGHLHHADVDSFVDPVESLGEAEDTRGRQRWRFGASAAGSGHQGERHEPKQEPEDHGSRA